jgi:DHA2 family methylenomycin A resistance protein-like MFS transporter
MSEHSLVLRERSPLLVATLCATGLGMVMFDNTTVIVALPAIRDAFHSSTNSQQWVLNALALMTGAMLPFSGAIGDRFGPKRIFRIGLLAFAFAALLGSFATSLGFLVACRALQGIGGAMILPNGIALLRANVRIEQRNRAIGQWISLGSIGLVVGPLGGGWLITHFGWRAAFYGHVPIALFGAYRSRHLSDGERRQSNLDYPGIATSSLAVLALCAGLIQVGRSNGNYIFASALLVAGIFLLAVFFLIEHRVEHPLIDPLWLTGVRTRGVLIACTIYNATIAGSTFLIAVLAQDSRHLTPFLGGVVVAAACILMPLGARISGRVVTIVDLRKVMLRGSIVLAVGYVIIAFAAQSPFVILLLTLLVTGFCAGLLFSGDTIAIVKVLSPEKASSGLATLSLMRQVGSVFGVALFGSVSELLGRGGSSINTGKSVTIALSGVATLSSYFFLRKALSPTPHD